VQPIPLWANRRLDRNLRFVDPLGDFLFLDLMKGRATRTSSSERIRITFPEASNMNTKRATAGDAERAALLYRIETTLRLIRTAANYP
jgi:hypothetical protein